MVLYLTILVIGLQWRCVQLESRRSLHMVRCMTILVMGSQWRCVQLDGRSCLLMIRYLSILVMGLQWKCVQFNVFITRPQEIHSLGIRLPDLGPDIGYRDSPGLRVSQQLLQRL